MSKNYYQKNKEKWNIYAIKQKENKKEWYKNNKEHKKEYDKKRREEKKELLKTQMNEYYINNKDVIRKYKKEWVANKRHNDKLYRLRTNMSSLIKASLKVKGLKKNSKTEQILGCSIIEFKSYLVSKFESWMSWDNYGKCNGELNYGWDIDHIIPSTSAKTEEDLYKLNHYTNLQPLCSYINRNIKRNISN